MNIQFLNFKPILPISNQRLKLKKETSSLRNVSSICDNKLITIPLYYQYNNFISFRGCPVNLVKGNVFCADDAIKLWSVLGKQQFCDTGDDSIHKEYKLIREKNYSFLDDINTDVEKDKFIQNFEKVTKFPNLTIISENIEKEFIKGAQKAEYINNVNTKSNTYEIMCAGYNDSCSVGLRKALPGSDIDGAYIVLRGSNYVPDEDVVNNFKKELWFNTDQRILSYNHPDSFPQVYTCNQIKNLIDETEIFSRLIPHEIKKNQNELFNSFSDDYVSVNPYFIALSKYFSKNIKYSREEIKNFGFFAESMKNGKLLYNTNNFYQNFFIKNGLIDIFRYSNMSQIKALQNQTNNKKKLQSREILCQNFKNFTISQQYEIIKNIIKNMSEDNDMNIDIYKKGTDLYRPLINLIAGEN